MDGGFYKHNLTQRTSDLLGSSPKSNVKFVSLEKFGIPLSSEYSNQLQKKKRNFFENDLINASSSMRDRRGINQN